MQILRRNLGAQFISQFQHFFDFNFKGSRIKVGIRNRHEQTAQNFMIHRPQSCYIEFSFDHDFRNAFQRVDEQILKFRHILSFAAHSPDFAARAFGRFLTLITKHTH